MLMVPGIFPKFWSTPFLRSPSTPTMFGTVSVLLLLIIILLLLPSSLITIIFHFLH